MKQSTITAQPLLKKVLRSLKAAAKGRRGFTSSASYWEDRYRDGGNSGAGSYNRLAVFKAETLNRYVVENAIGSVIEFGSGDGAQLELAQYPKYTGIDVSRSAVDAIRLRFDGNPSMKFLHSSEVTIDDRAELSLSLDVIYHLVEDEVFDAYMTNLFDAALRSVIVYASNEERSWPSPHVRHRNFTRWVERNRPDFKLVAVIANEYPYSEDDPANTSFADFFIYDRTAD